jgi:hypothetical protein
MTEKGYLTKVISEKRRENLSEKILEGSESPNGNPLNFLKELMSYGIPSDSDIYRGFLETLNGKYSQTDNLQYQTGHAIAEAIFRGAEMEFEEINHLLCESRPPAKR